MKKNGFTLIELVSVVTILAILAIIAVPQIVNQINAKKNEIGDIVKELIYTSTDLYLDENKNTYNEYAGNVFCVSLQSLVDDEFLIEPVLDTKTGQSVNLDYVVKIQINNKLQKNHQMIYDGSCHEIKRGKPSNPELVDGLIPIRWDATSNMWLKADVNNPSDFIWYDYNDHKWANAVLVTDDTRNDYVSANVGTEILEEDVLGYFTWIPRYRYKLWNTSNSNSNPRAIEITFESKETVKSTGSINDSWLTHPAFTFGDTELNGIWVGKFETTGTLEEMTVKPNQESITNQTLGNMFAATRLMEKNGNTYGLNKYQVDTHVMKNMEWGAVAYFTNSEYGRCNDGTCTEVWINNVNTGYGDGTAVENAPQWGPTITGCSGSSVSAAVVNNMGTCSNNLQEYNGVTGVHASTTDNVTGIYDLSGGSWEYVMGNMEDADSNYYPSESELMVLNSKYYNSYENSDSTTTHGRGLLGDATRETLTIFGDLNGGWNGDYASFTTENNSWLSRGGESNNTTKAGLFSFNKNTGGAYPSRGFRVVIVSEKENRQYVENNLNGADPELYQGLVPVYYENGITKVADLSNKWYSYSEHNWANAVLVDTSDATIKNKYFNEDMTLKDFISGYSIPDSDILQYYVWIPRYKYQLWNVNNGNSDPFAINIVFENKETEKSTGMVEDVYTNGEYYTHPAFTFGDTELNGIWVGKFETTGTIESLTIKPNLESLNNQTLGAMFNASRAIESAEKYGLATDEVDTHMMKNMDWGAVAYLTNSKYGRYDSNGTTCTTSGGCEVWINNVNTGYGNGTAIANTPQWGSTITGCSGASVSAVSIDNLTACQTNSQKYNGATGVNASTTGNITGIYDMSGGLWEYVMGNMVNTSDQYYASDSGLSKPDSKYYDLYDNDSTSTGYLNQQRGLLGDATRETLETYGSELGGWYDDYAYFIYDAASWFVRGGRMHDISNAGLFHFNRKTGDIDTRIGFRISLTAD